MQREMRHTAHTRHTHGADNHSKHTHGTQQTHIHDTHTTHTRHTHTAGRARVQTHTRHTANAQNTHKAHTHTHTAHRHSAGGWVGRGGAHGSNPSSTDCRNAGSMSSSAGAARHNVSATAATRAHQHLSRGHLSQTLHILRGHLMMGWAAAAGARAWQREAPRRAQFGGWCRTCACVRVCVWVSVRHGGTCCGRLGCSPSSRRPGPGDGLLHRIHQLLLLVHGCGQRRGGQSITGRFRCGAVIMRICFRLGIRDGLDDGAHHRSRPRLLPPPPPPRPLRPPPSSTSGSPGATPRLRRRPP